MFQPTTAAPAGKVMDYKKETTTTLKPTTAEPTTEQPTTAKPTADGGVVEDMELVDINGKMGTVTRKYFSLSTALLMLMGAALTVLFCHLITNHNFKKVVTMDREYTPIPDKV